LTFDDFRTQFDKFIKRKRKKNIFEVKQLQFEWSIIPDLAHSNLIFAFDGNLFVHWEYILINW
jgi:hypothetical protein